MTKQLLITLLIITPVSAMAFPPDEKSKAQHQYNTRFAARQAIANQNQSSASTQEDADAQDEQPIQPSAPAQIQKTQREYTPIAHRTRAAELAAQVAAGEALEREKEEDAANMRRQTQRMDANAATYRALRQNGNRDTDGCIFQ